MERLQPLSAGRIRVATLALGVLFVAVAAWMSWKFLGDSIARDMRSNSLLRVPLKWPQLVMPVGATLFALVLFGQLVQAIADLRAGRGVDRFEGTEH